MGIEWRVIVRGFVTAYFLMVVGIVHDIIGHGVPGGKEKDDIVV